MQSDPIGITQDYTDPMMQSAITQGALQETYSDGLNHVYGYVNQSPVVSTDPYGLGPISGGACAAGAAIYKLKGLKDLQDKVDDIRNNALSLLNKVNDRLSDCDPSSKRAHDLLKLKRRIQEQVLDQLSGLAAESFKGPAEQTQLLGMGMFCGGLTGLPIP